MSFIAKDPKTSYLHPLRAFTSFSPRAINFKSSLFAIRRGEILCFSGCHLHSSSKERSEKTRFSYEIRTICQNDIDNEIAAPNTDCKLRFQFPKIFRHIDDNSPLKLSS